MFGYILVVRPACEDLKDSISEEKNDVVVECLFDALIELFYLLRVSRTLSGFISETHS